MSVDNTDKKYEWGSMESTVRGVKLLTFREVVARPNRTVRRRVKKARRRTDGHS